MYSVKKRQKYYGKNINKVLIIAIIVITIVSYLVITTKKYDDFRTDLKRDVDIYSFKSNIVKEYNIKIIDKDTNEVLNTYKVKENGILAKPELVEKEGYIVKSFTDANDKEIDFEIDNIVSSDLEIYIEYFKGDVFIESIETEEVVNINLDDTYEIKYTTIPSYVSSKDITYSTTNRYTASVDEYGVVSANRKGICYITILDKKTYISTRVKIIVE